MKITRIGVYRTDLPYKGGRYGWGGEIASATLSHFAVSTPADYLINSTDLMNYNTRSTGIGGPTTKNGKLFASNAPGLGVEPDFASLGEPVASFGEAA